MKNVILLITALTMLSCNFSNKQEHCYKEYKTSLTYLKEYILHNEDKNYSLKEIEDNIQFLEEQSGVKSSDQGNLIGKFIITQDDINRWESWVKTKCSSENNTKND